MHLHRIILFLLLIAPAASFGECADFTVYAFSDVGNGGPQNIVWQVRNEANDILFNGNFTATQEQSSFEETVCLEPGCYSLRLIGNAVTHPEIFYGGARNAFGVEMAPTSPLNYGTQVFNFRFCTHITVTECEAMFSYVPSVPGSIQFTNESFTSVSNTEFLWTFGNLGSSPDFGPEWAFNQNGSFEVCLSVQNVTTDVVTCYDEYCEVVSIEDWYNPECPETELISSGICGNWLFDIPVTGYESVSWSWNGEVFDTGPAHSEISGMPGGTHDICAIVYTSGCPEGAEICVPVEVNDCIYSMCEMEVNAIYLGNGMFEFTAYGLPEIYPMQWNFGDGETLAATWVVMHQFDEPGTYTVCGGVTGSQCSGFVQGCVEVTVEDIAPCNAVSFGVNADVPSGSPTFLEYELIHVETEETVETGVMQFGSVISAWNRMICLAEGCYDLHLCNPYQEINWTDVEVFGNSNFSLIGWDSWCDGGRVYHFTLNGNCTQLRPFCQPVFSYSVQEDGSFAFDNNSFYNGQATFEWSFGDAGFSQELNPVHQFTGEGIFPVCLTIETSLGCSNETCQTLQVTAVDETAGNTVRVFPNPASEEIFVEVLKSGGSTRVEILDCTGRIVIREQWQEKSGRLDVSSLAPGLYLLRTISGNQFSTTEVVIR